MKKIAIISVAHWVCNVSFITINNKTSKYQTILRWSAQTHFHLHLAGCILATVYFWICNNLFYSFYANGVTNSARIMRILDGELPSFRAIDR